MKYKLVDIEEGKCYGIFESFEKAYYEGVNINHRIHLLCGGDYHIKFEIKEVYK